MIHIIKSCFFSQWHRQLGRNKSEYQREGGHTSRIYDLLVASPDALHPRRPRGSQSGGRKEVTKDFQRGQKTPWVPTLTNWNSSADSIRTFSWGIGRLWLVKKKMKVSLARTTLVNIPDKYNIVWRDNSSCVQTHEKNSGNAVCRLGTIIQSILLCPIRSQHSLDHLKMVRWELVPTAGAFLPVLENFRHAFSPDPTDCPWVSEDGCSTTELQPRRLVGAIRPLN